MDRDLCLLSIHAHPDDEASKGASTVAKYADERIRGVLVTCTGGEEGDIMNAALDTPDVKNNLQEVRLAELEASVKIIGYEKLHLLGYRDSGMADSEPNARPDNFQNAPLQEAVDRLARIIRLEQADVAITYAEDQSRYPHPDHLKVHEITMPAVLRAADPHWTDGGAAGRVGEPWQVSKIYWSNGFTRGRLFAMHKWFLDQGHESPYAEWIGKIRDDADRHLTTRIDISDHVGVARESLRAHATQIDPDGHWFKVPVDHMVEHHPWEEFMLAFSLCGPMERDEHGFETDLFAGLR